MRYTFFKKYAEAEEERLAPDLKKVLYEVKASGQHLRFSIFWQFSTWAYNKNKPYKCSDW